METVSVPISSIQLPPEEVSLRPAPSEKDSDYDRFLDLKNDIAHRGLMQLFSVRKDGDVCYVIDGFRRLTALKQLEAEGKLHPTLVDTDGSTGVVTVQVREDSEWDALASQISANYNRKKTMSTQDIKSLQRILYHTNCTLSQLATKVGMSEQYVTQLLKLQSLPTEVQEGIDSKEIPLVNAIQLSRLPADVQDDFIDSAKEMTGEEFTVAVSTRLNEIKKENKTGARPKEFTAQMKLLKKADLEILYIQAGSDFEDNPSDENRGALEMIKKVFQMDDGSVEAARVKWEADEEARKLKEEDRKANREKKKIEDLAKYAEENGLKLVPVNDE